MVCILCVVKNRNTVHYQIVVKGGELQSIFRDWETYKIRGNDFHQYGKALGQGYIYFKINIQKL